MIPSIDVFKIIKALSKHTLNPCPRLSFAALIKNCSLQRDALFVLLIELENRGLIKINYTAVTTINLTLYGSSQDSVTGGLYSEDR
ncbi:hypothetical protein [Niabella hibiscisoli]|uniref:hypothetical protein n=1 Tax=Niabella hibiscisoli TaxID=1825928 RepID=UPI001F102342|nr:hypothetical protein [Niabella hibiscisoli]MCH5718580.1 hypothetical protein [Niabella hibiscisoli]